MSHECVSPSPRYFGSTLAEWARHCAARHRIGSLSSAERLQAVGHHPHAEVLRIGAIGHGEGRLSSVNLVFTGDTAHLVGRFGEAEQTRSADGVGREDAAGAVDRKRTTDLGVPSVGHLPTLALFGD